MLALPKVLILVVMEDGLVQDIKSITIVGNEVLILVVMEDGLVLIFLLLMMLLQVS